ncbi:MAG: ATP-binding cassette domain-containing protein [Alphaproteobacteria bacterium]|nr:MAG: ATP-binding cassette domain-containing protein [Alphaproteobacteria bacterium]
MTAVFGPNGIGKTTFLKLITGLIKPTSGNVILNTNQIGFLAQRNTLDIHFPITLYEMVEMGQVSSTALPVKTALERVGLWNMRYKYLDELSGGQFQRALFARLIVQNPEFILLDEPFNAVDCQTLNYLIEQLKLWHKEGKTILVVLHDFDLIQKHFKECIFVGHDFIKKLTVKDISFEKMTQMMFCGQHYAS